MRSLQRGQGLIDYALILVLVAIVLVVVFSLSGHQILNAFPNVANTFQSP